MHQRTLVRRLGLLALFVALLAAVGALRAAPAQQDAYPALQPTADPLVATPTLAAYPPGIAPEATPAVIGVPLDDTATVGTVALASAAPGTPDARGLLYLWLGFAATLLIFGASVIGAVILFTRRAQP